MLVFTLARANKRFLVVTYNFTSAIKNLIAFTEVIACRGYVLTVWVFNGHGSAVAVLSDQTCVCQNLFNRSDMVCFLSFVCLFGYLFVLKQM